MSLQQGPASAGRFVPHVVPLVQRPAVTVQRLNTSTITISNLAQKVRDVVHDPKLPKYSDGVVEMIDHLRRIADQLGEGIELYPPLRLPPGGLADELAALIIKKEEALLIKKKTTKRTSTRFPRSTALKGTNPRRPCR